MKESTGKQIRRNYFSDPKTQSRVLIFFFVLSFVYAVLNIDISHRAYNALSDDIMGIETMPASSRFEAKVITDKYAYVLTIQSILFAILSMGMLMMAGMLLSHRIGGPITNLRLYMSRVCSGEIEARPVRFRKDDLCHELATLFNRFQVKFGIISEGDTEATDTTPGK